MKNLTPHEITLINNKTGKKTVLKPSGIIARVSVKEEVFAVCQYTGLDIIKREFTSIENLPEEKSVYIVSALVLEAIKKNNIKDERIFYAPDTGNTAVRNNEGNIVAVTRLIKI